MINFYHKHTYNGLIEIFSAPEFGHIKLLSAPQSGITSHTIYLKNTLIHTTLASNSTYLWTDMACHGFKMVLKDTNEKKNPNIFILTE